MKYPVYGPKEAGNSVIYLYPEKKAGYSQVGAVECDSDCEGCAVKRIGMKVLEFIPHDTDKKAYDILVTKTCRRVEIRIRRSNTPGQGKVVGKNQADRFQIVYNAIILGFEKVAY